MASNELWDWADHWFDCFPYGFNDCRCHSEKERKLIMLQKRQTENAGAFGGKPLPGGGATNGLPFLKNEHLSTEPRTLYVVMTRAETDRWQNPSVLMQVRYDGKLFQWQVNNRNPNFDMMIDILGEDETKWAGGEVSIRLEQDPVSQKYWPRVSAITRKVKKGD